MNYATVVNGPFSSNGNGNTQYSRLSYPQSGYGQQTSAPGQDPQMMSYQTLNSSAGQQVNVYQPFSQIPTLKDPRTNIHIGSKLFVGQVPAMTTEEQLRPVFEPYGELLEVKIMRDPLGRSKGSAWVRYETNEMAMNAINALNEKHTVPPQTNPLRVQFATPNNVRHQQSQQQQQKFQQQSGYAFELKGPMNQYNFGGPMSGGVQQGRMVMLRSGASPNIVPSIPTNTGNRQMFSPFGGGPMESPPFINGPYTSSTNRFDNNNSAGSRRDVYSSLELPQSTAPQLCQQQQRGGYSTPVVGPSSAYNQVPPSRQIVSRNPNIKTTGGVDAGEAMGGNNNSNGAPTMANDMSSMDAGMVIWESRGGNSLHGQDQREAVSRVRAGERKE